jgi:hypothetical protein
MFHWTLLLSSQTPPYQHLPESSGREDTGARQGEVMLCRVWLAAKILLADGQCRSTEGSLCCFNRSCGQRKLDVSGDELADEGTIQKEGESRGSVALLLTLQLARLTVSSPDLLVS